MLEHELKPIQELCQKLYHGKVGPPKITIVVVGKRHHTRFYPTAAEHADTYHQDNNEKLYNCRPGTVVDRGITMLKGWDFFLQAHAAIKGTVSIVSQMASYSTEYRLGKTRALRGTPQWNRAECQSTREDHPQSLLSRRCLPASFFFWLLQHFRWRHKTQERRRLTEDKRQYGRTTKAVSICPPVYYADIICERGRCYLMKILNTRGKPLGQKYPWPTTDDVPVKPE